ncbi:MAG TPA: OmpA family protein, partial [Clostridia bacterium]|nr:OmpA family protein [Clostridia bacterium]
MKLTKFTNLLVLGLLLTVAVSGCKKKPGAITPLPAGARAGVTDLETSPPLTGVPSTTSDDALKSMTDGIASIDPSKFKDWTPDRATLQAQMVFFDFDSSVVRGSERSKVAAVADYMKANAGNAVRVEGHCDERGTEEYNRALGDRRAQALR